MAKVEVTALQTLHGDYGTASNGDKIQMEEKDAIRLAKAGVVSYGGVESEGKTQNSGKQLLPKAERHMDSSKIVEPKVTEVVKKPAKKK